MTKILIWGTGEVYRRNLSFIRYIEMAGQISVIGVTATDISRQGVLDGYNLLPPNEISEKRFDYILIMNRKNELEIVKTIINMGYSKERCIFERVMHLPGFDFEKYVRLRRSNISIISNNCWGGMVYQVLGMECLSPFKNLSLEDSDYFRLLGNLNYYLSCVPKKAGFGIDDHSGDRYPLIMLDDVTVHCNHDKNHDEAIKKWNRRVKKFNFDNVFVAFYSENYKQVSEFLRLDDYKKKLCMSTFEEPDECSVRLKLKSDQELWEAVLETARSLEPEFYLIDLLLGNIVRRS